MKNKYRIKYKIIFEDAPALENKEINIDNCHNGVHAQIRLEEYLRKKYINFKQLIVFECEEMIKTPFGDFAGNFNSGMGDIFNQFGGIFGGKSK